MKIGFIKIFLAQRTSLVYFFDRNRPTNEQAQAAFETDFGAYFQEVLQTANRVVTEEAEKGNKEDSGLIFHQAVHKKINEMDGEKVYRMVQNMTDYRAACNNE